MTVKSAQDAISPHRCEKCGEIPEVVNLFVTIHVVACGCSRSDPPLETGREAVIRWNAGHRKPRHEKFR